MPERHVRNLEAIRSNLSYIITPQINAKYCVFNSWLSLLLITLWKSSSAIPAVAGLAVQTYCRELLLLGADEKSIRRLRSRSGHCCSPPAAGCAPHPHTADSNETLTGHFSQGRGKSSFAQIYAEIIWILRVHPNTPDGVDQIRLCTSARVVWWNFVDSKLQKTARRMKIWILLEL